MVTSYEYYNSARGGNFTTIKLKSENINGTTYMYEYDALGNITCIDKKIGNHIYQLYYYEYDELNQLTNIIDYENNCGYQYYYDLNGYITTDKRFDIGTNGAGYNYTVNTYSYTDTNRKDKLTAYNGQTITYDAIGNPLTYRDSITMTWQNGRELFPMCKIKILL